MMVYTLIMVFSHVNQFVSPLSLFRVNQIILRLQPARRGTTLICGETFRARFLGVDQLHEYRFEW